MKHAIQYSGNKEMHLLMEERIRVAKTDCNIVGEFLLGEDTPYLVVIDD